MEPSTIVAFAALAIAGLVGLSTVTASIRRNGTNGTPDKALIEVAKMMQATLTTMQNAVTAQQSAMTAIVADQATMTANQARIIDYLGTFGESMNRLVEVHNKSESTIGRLEELMERLERDRRTRKD